MDVSEARKQLEMVDRIVSVSERSLRVGGEFFVIWGCVSAGIDTLLGLVTNGLVPTVVVYSVPVLILLGVAITIPRVRHYRQSATSMSLLQREYLRVMWVSLGMAFVCDLIARHLFAGWAQFAIWSVTGGTVLFFIALHGNRRALAGGTIVVASLIAADLLPQMFTAAILAGGMLVGYAGFGLAELLARD